MPYLFILLVGVNAAYMGYYLLKQKEPSVLPEFQVQQNQHYPEKIELVNR